MAPVRRGRNQIGGRRRFGVPPSGGGRDDNARRDSLPVALLLTSRRLKPLGGRRVRARGLQVALLLTSRG